MSKYYIANTLAINKTDEHPIPDVIEVAPLLENHGNAKGKFSITEQDIDNMIANQSLDIVIDAEHQTLNTNKNGQPAPAYGWIKSLFKKVVDNTTKLFANVEWTKLGEEAIQDGSYKYISPVFWFNAKDRATGDVIGTVLHSIGLTNVPNIEGIQPLWNTYEGGDMEEEKVEAQENEQVVENSTDFKETELEIAFDNEIYSKIWAFEDTCWDIRRSDKSIEEKKELLTTAVKEFATAITEALQEEGKDSKTGESEEDMTENKTNPGAVVQPGVSKEEVEKLLENKMNIQKAEAAVNDAINDGRLTGENKELFMNKAKSDPDFVIQAVSKMQKVVPTDTVVGDTEPQANTVVLTEEDEAIANQLNISQEDMSNERKGEIE